MTRRLTADRAEFTSYYGRPVIKKPTWTARDIGGYLFLGGVAGASSTLAAAADLTGRRRLARASKAGAAVAAAGSLAALIHDLGKPGRFVNMLRVVKVTSPMSVGSWLLAMYVPAAGVAWAASAMRGPGRRGPGRRGSAGRASARRAPVIGMAATVAAGVLGPAVATYTAPLISDTAVPLWHEAYREMPAIFAASAAAGAGGLAMMAAPTGEAAPARRVAVAAALVDGVASRALRRRLGVAAEPLETGRAGALMRAGRSLTAGGALLGAALGRRSRVASCLAGASLLAGAACTKFGVFTAGVASAEDPLYTVRPQRRRLDERRRLEDAEQERAEGGIARRPAEEPAEQERADGGIARRPAEEGGERRRSGVGVPVETGGPNAGSNRRWPAPSAARGSIRGSTRGRDGRR